MFFFATLCCRHLASLLKSVLSANDLMQAMLTLSCWQASKRAELHPLGDVSTSIAGAQGLEAQADETNFDKLSESLRALSSGLAPS